MSEVATFAGEGYKSFPNIHSDRIVASSCVEWTDERLNEQVDAYGDFIQRTDIMERARKTGNKILDLLLFELAMRDGVYDDPRRFEDEVSHV